MGIFIERAGPSGLDEHPGTTSSWARRIQKRSSDGLMNSPSWASSVLSCRMTKAGGLYDHVLPASAVPPDTIPPHAEKREINLAISRTSDSHTYRSCFSLVRPNFVSHTWRDLTSILRLIESGSRARAHRARCRRRTICGVF